MVRPLDRLELAPDPNRRKRLKPVKLLDLPPNNLIRCLSIVLNSEQSGQLFRRCRGNVGGGLWDLRSQSQLLCENTPRQTTRPSAGGSGNRNAVLFATRRSIAALWRCIDRDMAYKIQGASNLGSKQRPKPLRVLGILYRNRLRYSSG